MDYVGDRICLGEFKGTLKHKKEVVSISHTFGKSISFYTHWGYFDEDETLKSEEALNDKVFSEYEYNQASESMMRFMTQDADESP